MSRFPTKQIRRRLMIGTPIDKAEFSKDKFEKPDADAPPPETLRLAEYLAAVRREMEAVAMIAASDDPEIPRFHLSEVEVDLVCAISEVTDEGLRVVVSQKALAETPDGLLQRVKLKMSDPVVKQAQEAAALKALKGD